MALRCPGALLLLFSVVVGACKGDDKAVQTDDSQTDDSQAGDDSASGGLDPATVPLTGACDMDVDFGGFAVAATEGETSVAGGVTDGVVPASVLEPLATEGDCTLLRRNNPYCDPTCSSGEACDFDGECVPYPVRQDLGTVTISGLVQDSVMTAVFPGNTYYDTSLPHPAFNGGELITLSMPEGAYGPAELHGVGVETLDMTGITWTIGADVDTTITWPAVSAPRSTVNVRISIDQHGVTPSALHCSFDDDGSGTIPGSIIATMVEKGVTGFPTGSIERLTADKTDAGAGCMDFTVSSQRTINVDVIGYTPCLSEAECPDGQTCNVELQICE